MAVLWAVGSNIFAGPELRLVGLRAFGFKVP